MNYNPKMETKAVGKTRVYYHKKLNKTLVFDCGHPEDGALYLMREYDMFKGDVQDDPNCIIYYAVEKTELWPVNYFYGENIIATDVNHPTQYTERVEYGS